jgi:hypothetical protein
VLRWRTRPGDVVAPRSLATACGPAVAVPDPERLVRLRFRRFAGCPVCNLHLQSVVRRHAEIEEAGIREVVVFHSSARALSDTRPGSRSPWSPIPARGCMRSSAWSPGPAHCSVRAPGGRSPCGDAQREGNRDAGHGDGDGLALGADRDHAAGVAGRQGPGRAGGHTGHGTGDHGEGM